MNETTTFSKQTLTKDCRAEDKRTERPWLTNSNMKEYSKDDEGAGSLFFHDKEESAKGRRSSRCEVSFF